MVLFAVFTVCTRIMIDGALRFGDVETWEKLIENFEHVLGNKVQLNLDSPNGSSKGTSVFFANCDSSWHSVSLCDSPGQSSGRCQILM